MLQRGAEGAEFAKRVPTQVVLFHQLLHVLGGRAAGTRFKKAATVHQRHDGQHLGRGADFQDRIEVRQVVAQHVAGDGDGVEALGNPLRRVAGCIARGHDLQVEARRVMLRQIGFHLLDQLGIVGAVLVQPEHARHAGEAGTADAELHPVADRGVLGEAGAPDVAAFNRMLQQRGAGRINDADGAIGLGLEGLRVRAVFLGLLGHQADVRHGAHLGRIKSAVLLAELDHRVIDAGIGRVRNHALGVIFLAIRAPALAAGADEGGHGGVDDDVGRDMQVGDALVGVHHVHGRAIVERSLEAGLDFSRLVSRQGGNLGFQIADAEVRVDADFRKGGRVLGEEVLQEGLDHMAEDDRVGDLHHRGLEVHGEEHALVLGILNFLLEESGQGLGAHEGCVQHIAFGELQVVLQNGDGTILGHELDACGASRCSGNRHGLFVGGKVVLAHGGDMGLGGG